MRAGCARIRRRESLRRASAHHRKSYRGACRHAAWQREWGARAKQKMTHQGYAEPLVAAIVAIATAIPENDLTAPFFLATACM